MAKRKQSSSSLLYKKTRSSKQTSDQKKIDYMKRKESRHGYNRAHDIPTKTTAFNEFLDVGVPIQKNALAKNRNKRKVDKIKKDTAQTYQPPASKEYKSGRQTPDVEESKTTKFITNISDPNQLFEYASYNYLFTLSCLSNADLVDSPTLMNNAPHDIIVQSAGMGGSANETPVPGVNYGANALKTLKENPDVLKALRNSKETLSKARDMYIENVKMTAVPGLNADRAFTSVSQLSIQINEPFGISLIERLRAAAANNGYLDHLDAAYLLTLEFKGFDENSRPVDGGKNSKRLFPIKLTDIDVEVVTGATTYNVKAIPWNEFAYVDRFAKVRTAGTVSTSGRTLGEMVEALEDLLNKQNNDEKDKNLVGIPDQYEITVTDEQMAAQQVNNTNYEQTGMGAADYTGADFGFVSTANPEAEMTEHLKIRKGMYIPKVLQEMLTGLPNFQDKNFKEWRKKVKTNLSVYGNKSFPGDGDQALYERIQKDALKDAKDREFFFPYFQIRSAVQVLPEFDEIRGTNVKKIHFFIEPLLVHAYSLSIPGVANGQSMKDFVHKTYNYVFTGENLDIMDLQIKYRYSYFTSSLKKEADGREEDNVVGITATREGTSAKDHFQDTGGALHFKKEVTIDSTSDQGAQHEKSKELEQFLDYITNPMADMVNITMDILGDPAWISQSQVIPYFPTKVGQGLGDIQEYTEFWRYGANKLWNSELRCYNAEHANPIIMLNFRMPTDLDDKTGIYELRSDQSATFSGLYGVYKVEHNFENGRYTNRLNMYRFNNQTPFSSNPMPQFNVVTIDGKTFVKSESEMNNIFQTFGMKLPFVNIQRKIEGMISKGFNKIKKRASKIFNSGIRL